METSFLWDPTGLCLDVERVTRSSSVDQTLAREYGAGTLLSRLPAGDGEEGDNKVSPPCFRWHVTREISAKNRAAP